MLSWFRSLFTSARGRHRDGTSSRHVVWQLKAERIRAQRRYPSAAIVRHARAANLRSALATTRMPARARFTTATAPARARVASAAAGAVAVGSHLVRQVGAHRRSTATAEHRDMAAQILARAQRADAKLARRRARGEQSLFAPRPKGAMTW